MSQPPHSLDVVFLRFRKPTSSIAELTAFRALNAQITLSLPLFSLSVPPFRCSVIADHPFIRPPSVILPVIAIICTAHAEGSVYVCVSLRLCVWVSEINRYDNMINWRVGKG